MYTQLGFEHILDPKGYDHILFVVALCAVYNYRDWKKILVLVTAFTVGHSLTLALSVLKIVRISPDLVETLIPITIILTCIYNMVKGKVENQKNIFGYLMALFFGLIHGLGFSNYLNALLSKDESLTWALLSFNVGVELGQIIIVGATFMLSYVTVGLLKMKHSYFNYIVSSIILMWALLMMVG